MNSFLWSRKACAPTERSSPALVCEVEPSGGGAIVVAVTCTSDEPIDAGVRVELLLVATDDPSG